MSANDISCKKVDKAMGACGWDMADPHGAAVCLLADLRHWCDRHGVSFVEALDKSERMYADDRRLFGGEATEMTASRPDLDALEARLLDAERNDLLVEHGVRFTDIKWLIAAARERDALNAHLTEVSDTYRASAEAFQRALAAERQQRERLQAELDGRRMCVTCGKYAPAGADRTYEDPACTGPDGMNPCLFDGTPDEAWQHWRQEAHAERQRAERAEQQAARLRAALEEAREYIEAPWDPIATRLIGRIDAALAPEQEVEP